MTIHHFFRYDAVDDSIKLITNFFVERKHSSEIFYVNKVHKLDEMNIVTLNKQDSMFHTEIVTLNIDSLFDNFKVAKTYINLPSFEAFLNFKCKNKCEISFKDSLWAIKYRDRYLEDKTLLNLMMRAIDNNIWLNNYTTFEEYYLGKH
jgi:hypothetical protein